MTLARAHNRDTVPLMALKIRMVYQFSANQKEWNKTNSLQAVKQALLKGREITFDAHDSSKMATLHVKKPRKIAAWNHGKTA